MHCRSPSESQHRLCLGGHLDLERNYHLTGHLDLVGLVGGLSAFFMLPVDNRLPYFESQLKLAEEAAAAAGTRYEQN
jgi:hypothetical protein